MDINQIRQLLKTEIRNAGLTKEPIKLFINKGYCTTNRKRVAQAIRRRDRLTHELKGYDIILYMKTIKMVSQLEYKGNMHKAIRREIRHELAHIKYHHFNKAWGIFGERINHFIQEIMAERYAHKY